MEISFIVLSPPTRTLYFIFCSKSFVFSFRELTESQSPTIRWSIVGHCGLKWVRQATSLHKIPCYGLLPRDSFLPQGFPLMFDLVMSLGKFNSIHVQGLLLCAAIGFLFFSTSTARSNCSTWHYFSEEDCVCGSTLEDVVVCNDTLGIVGVLDYYCLTSDGEQSVVGDCLVEDVHRKRLLGPFSHYKKVFPTLSEQDSYTCGFLNRHGRLCGQCKPNTSIHAYTYDMKCYPCPSNIGIEVIKYIAVAYIPLTLFLVIVVVFHISVTSPAMNVPVLCCQLFSLPFALRFFWQYSLKYPHIRSFVMVFGTIYGIWNLDFFRLVIPPICLQLDVMQLIALDLLVAAYPLVVLVCVYLLLTAHDRGCRLVVRLWRPFLWCSARVRQQWNVRHSIIDAFATFLLLSVLH